MRQIACVVLPLLGLLSTFAHAQSAPTPLQDAVRREAARLATSERVATASIAETQSAQGAAPQRSWPARHPVLLGTLTGTGIGLGVLATQDCRASSDYTCSGLAAFFGGTGAGLGALGGLIVSIFVR